ncbi:MAG: superfamily [Prolixibacteraceae bacterium]|nr:MAG: superfamily [Prolixibacteraceae bacterium]
MRKNIFFYLIFSLLYICELSAQTSSLQISTTVSKEILRDFQSKGRIFLFIADGSNREPRLNTWPNKSNRIFATNPENWNGAEPFIFDGTASLNKSVDLSLNNLPNVKYTIQVLWDQDFKESRINAPGNLYSEALNVEIKENATIDLPLTKVVGPEELAEHKLLKKVDTKSEVLSASWGKEMRLKAAVILRLLVRNITGEPILSQKDFIQLENVLGYSDTYVTSGGQFSAFTALFSPKGDDGLPKPMLDPVTGKIDREVAEYWRKYDLKDYV